MLPRALGSLLSQTHTDWICELHNDDPDDPFPGQLVARVNDPRITYVRHERNLGPTGTFNCAFRSVREPFISLLEDDNWWEPRMLERLLAELSTRPEIALAWVNSWLWRETEAGAWERDGTIWPVDSAHSVSIFDSPHPRQACSVIHSHGAMVLRVSERTMFPCPAEMPVFAIEPVRERGYPGSLLLVREPLANFAITRESWRSESADENLQVLVLLAHTFLAGSNFTDTFHEQMWRECSGGRGHQHRALVVGAVLTGRLRRVLRSASIRDLALVAGWAVRHPMRFGKLFKARTRFPELFGFLQAAARARVPAGESRARLQ